LQRDGAISVAASHATWERLSSLLSNSTVILPSDGMRDLAVAQIERFPLQAGDALQLAAALVWCRQKPRGRQFVCNDRQLGAAAETAGFTVESV
jgi:hypothetical protein